MTFKQNIVALKGYLLLAPNSNKDKIRTVIKLYEDKKIVNFKTALNTITWLASQNKNVIKSGKADREYDKVVGKYRDAPSMVGRLKGVDAYEQKHFKITVIFYTSASDDDQKGEEQERRLARRKNTKYFKTLRQCFFGEYYLKLKFPLSQGAGELFNQYYQRLLTIDKKALEKLGQELTDDIKEDFDAMVKIFKGGNKHLKDMFDEFGNSYITGIYIMNYKTIDIKKVKASNPLTSRKRATENIDTRYAYINTELDLSRSTLKAALEKAHYTKNECWINTLLDVYGETLFSQNKQHRYRLTREKLLEIIGKTEANVRDGLTIQDMEPFFIKFRLQVRVYNPLHALIYEYNPEIRNPHNKVLRCMTKNNHIYTLNHNLKSLEQQDEEDDFRVKASSDYRVDEDRKPETYKMINNVDDILRIVKTTKEENPDLEEGHTIHLVVSADDLKGMFFNLKKVGYEPGVNFDCRRLSALYLKFNGLNITIKSQQLVSTILDGDIALEDEAIYNKTTEAMTLFHTALFRTNLKSYYNKEDIDILDEYRTKANIGMIKKISKKEPMVEIDKTKAYTAVFRSITRVPIFNIFDIWKPYNNEQIRDYSLYLIKSTKSNLFCNNTFNLCYGMHLSKLILQVNLNNPDVAFEILYFKEPSRIVPVEFKKIANTLFDCFNKISNDPDEDNKLKKLISNVNIGLLEKSQNTRSKSMVFNSIEEAKHYQIQYGGTIQSIQEYEQTMTNGFVDPYKSNLDKGINFSDDDDKEDDLLITHSVAYNTVKTGKEYFILTVSDTAILTNGFRYIKELLLQTHNFQMFEAYQKLSKYNVPVYSVKTDAFTIKASDLEKAESLLTFDEGFGSWRLSKTADIIYPTQKLYSYMDVNNHLIQVKPLVVNRLEVPNEYDNDHICRLFQEHRRVIVKASLPGSGKSYSCKYMENLGHNVIFICPTNELCRYNLLEGIISVTVHSFFGCGIDDEMRVGKFDDSKFDVVVFDEINLNDLKFLTRIKQYCDNHPEKIILATGDVFQNDPIDPLSTEFEHKQYSNHITSVIFPNEIFLQENKRLNNDADKQKLVKLQQDLFDDEKQVAKTLRENFRFTNKIETLNNISYRNNIAEEVSINVRKKLNKTSEYEVGEVLLCKKFIKTKAYRKLKNDKGVKKIGKYNLNNNCKYEIVENNGDLITLKETHYDFVELSTIDEDDDIKIIKNKGESAMISYDVFVELPRQMIEQRFIYNYCRTGHSLQGVTLKEKMTVFDHRFLERDQDKLRKWIWVAVTRATSFDQVLIFGGGDVEFNDQLWQMYMKDKITQYKNQDKKAGRGINAENYITTEWLDNAVTGICYFCHNSFDLSFKGCKVDCNLTADRIDDTLGHELNNIRACCNYCNTRKLK